MGVLKWKDPWQRDYTELNVLYDTGFCNRIFHWEIASHLNREFYNNEFTIAVEESQWPELDELINLPNTIVIPKEEEIRYFNNLNDIQIKDWETLGKAFTNDIPLDSEKNYVSKFSFTDLGYFFEHRGELVDLEIRPLQYIKLKDENIQTIIEDSVSDLVGVHMRRGRGVKIPETLYTNSEYSDYIKFREEQGAIENSIFTYHRD